MAASMPTRASLSLMLLMPAFSRSQRSLVCPARFFRPVVFAQRWSLKRKRARPDVAGRVRRSRGARWIHAGAEGADARRVSAADHQYPSITAPEVSGLEAWKQALAAGEAVAGCTVHYVDPGVDSGKIIAQREVPVLPNDTPETLHSRIQIAERELYPEVIAQFSR
jgi:hypothetical protein